MDFKPRLKLTATLLATALFFSACQSLIPSAQGLVKPRRVAQTYQRQDQIEVEWKKHSFSFLLYQQQNGQNLEMVALSLTGQQLFKLSFDGKKVDVQQRINQMKLLPFEYIVRDLLYATYPKFTQLQGSQIRVETNSSTQKIYIQQQAVLEIVHQPDSIELNNVQVPYQMVISSIDESLESDEASNAQ